MPFLQAKFCVMRYLLPICFLYVSVCLSQQQVQFVDDFKDARNGWGWTELNTPEKVCEREDEVLKLINKSETMPAFFFSSHWMNLEKDYTIEVDFTLKSGSVVAFVWGSDAFGMDYNSILMAEEEFVIESWEKGNENILHKEKNNGRFKAGLSSELKILKRSGNTIIQLNGRDLGRVPSGLNNSGPFLGFELLLKSELHISRFDVTYYPKSKKDINLVGHAELEFEKKSLGLSVNTNVDEINPVISADGTELYYTHSNHVGEDVSLYEDNIYRTYLFGGNWTNGKSLGAPVNTDAFNDIVSVLPDGNEIIVKGQYDKTKSGEIPLYTSHKIKSGWSAPKRLKTQKLTTKADHVSNCMSPSHDVIISSLKQSGSKGLDLYVSKKQKDGTYAVPVSMGEVLNTIGDEETPFIAADNQTLYFSSDGHAGFGSHDIFISHRLDDSWTNWSKPENLGPTLNTPDWDAYYSVCASGEYAYMVSYTNSQGGADVFRMKLPDEAKPQPVVIIFGKVINKKTKAPVEAEIHYFDITKNKEVGMAISNPEDGSYKIVLPKGIEYGFVAEKKGFYSIGEHFDMTEVNSYTELEKTLFLAPIEEGQTIVLNNIFFETDKADLKRTSYGELDRLIDLLNDIPTLIIEIDGHTDNSGSLEYNQKLSEDRAKAVFNYVTKKGIVYSRVKVKGFGETVPLGDNGTEEGRQINRRVEFQVLKR